MLELASSRWLDPVQTSSDGLEREFKFFNWLQGEILVEELAIAGHDTALPHGELSAEQSRLRADYQARFGDWPDFCDHLLRLDPGYFAVMLELLAVAPPSNGLDPKSRGLIALALSACFTSLNPHGLRLQIRRALRLGIHHREILQVLQMTAHLGVHACAVGVPLVLEAIGEAPDGGDGKAP